MGALGEGFQRRRRLGGGGGGGPDAEGPATAGTEVWAVFHALTHCPVCPGSLHRLHLCLGNWLPCDQFHGRYCIARAAPYTRHDRGNPERTAGKESLSQVPFLIIYKSVLISGYPRKDWYLRLFICLKLDRAPRIRCLKRIIMHIYIHLRGTGGPNGTFMTSDDNTRSVFEHYLALT